ncbi:MAG: alpha/beta hydrolase [Sulfurospirillaceae bacterium]|nr:alpha/beta hydrolase [Sulfurospirillaceae bacterium]
MKFFVGFFIFLRVLCASEQTETFVAEPIFNASVYIKTVGNPEKPAIVFVHGLGDEASTIWEQSISLLKENYFVVTFDLPGFGKSSKANELYSPQNYAKVVRFLTQTYVKKPFHLVGHSMGGAIALKYAHMYQEDVESLVLVSAAGILHKFAYGKSLAHNGINRFFDEKNGFIQGLQTQKLNNFIDKITDKIDNKITLDIDRVLLSEDLRGVVLGGTPHTIAAVALVQENFNGIPQTINTKTTIIWGEEDGVAPLQTGYVLEKLMPNATLKIIPRSGHVPMLTHEEAFSHWLLEHLNTKTIFAKKVPKKETDAYHIKMKNVKDKIYTGNIATMTVRDSQKVVIKDATIGELAIFDSDVEIINSTIRGQKELILTVQNSSLSIVSSDIVGSIKLNNARLNLAGTTMSSRKKPIEAITPSTVIFSLCTINDKYKHGKEVFGR